MMLSLLAAISETRNHKIFFPPAVSLLPKKSGLNTATCFRIKLIHILVQVRICLLFQVIVREIGEIIEFGV